MVCSAALRFCCEKKIREYDCPLPQAADKVCAMDPCAVCQTGPLLAPLLAVAIISTVGFSQREREREVKGLWQTDRIHRVVHGTIHMDNVK